MERQSEERKKRKKESQEKRKNSSFILEEPFSQSIFEETCKKVCKRIKRIKSTSISGPVVICKVRSQSGISDWEFKIDFNDFGDLTGRYWISTENYDSNIPKRIAELIIEELQTIGPLKPDNSYLDYKENPKNNSITYTNTESDGLSIITLIVVLFLMVIMIGILVLLLE